MRFSEVIHIFGSYNNNNFFLLFGFFFSEGKIGGEKFAGRWVRRMIRRTDRFVTGRVLNTSQLFGNTAKITNLAKRKINNLRVLNTLDESESRPTHQINLIGSIGYPPVGCLPVRDSVRYMCITLIISAPCKIPPACFRQVRKTERSSNIQRNR